MTTTEDRAQNLQWKAIRRFIVCGFLATLASLINSAQWEQLKKSILTEALSDQDSSSAVKLQPPTFSGIQTFGPRDRLKVGHSQVVFGAGTNATTANDSYDVQFYETKDPYYAAAWLCTMQTFLANPNFQPRPNKNYDPNLEGGTYAGVVGRKNYRTMDMLDFFVHHLSHYKIWFKHLNKTTNTEENNHWTLFLNGLQRMQQDYEVERYNNPSGHRNGQVLVLVPFNGASDRHSAQDEKLLYLNITVKTLAGVFPNIVVSVCNPESYDYVVKESGLNEYLYDVLYLRNLTRRNHLPHATSRYAQLELQPGGKWHDAGFEWVYYTEADQIPTLRNVDALLRQTLQDNRTVVVPHRSLPLPILGEDVFGTVKTGSREKLGAWENKTVLSVPDLEGYRCCFDFSNQTEIPFAQPEVQLFRQRHSHAQIAGACNQFSKACHVCQLAERTSPCPPVTSQ